jgi:hypothetical protein
MGSDFSGGPTFKTDAKEYARFCRLRGLFLVDGLEPWRTALKARGYTEEELALKIAGAADFVRRMGDPTPDGRSAEPRIS